MTRITHCLYIRTGIIVIVDQDADMENVENERFSISIVGKEVLFQSEKIAVPFTAGVIEHMLAAEERNIYFYGGRSSMELEFMFSVELDEGLLLRAQGALWALAGEPKGEEQPKAPALEGVSTTEDDSEAEKLFNGLRMPPGFTQDNHKTVESGVLPRKH